MKCAKLVITKVKTQATISVTAGKPSCALLLQKEVFACLTGGRQNEKCWYPYIRDFLQPQEVASYLLQVAT